jgi:hypothetical protein
MTKFFRKYSRFFILGFMSLLLVIFLIQDAVGRGQRRQQNAYANAEIGQAFGKTIRQRDVQQAGADIEIADSLGLSGLPIPGKDEFERNLNAHLLMEEAAHMGVRASRDEIHSRLDEIPGAGARFDAACRRFSCAPEAVNAALERVMSVVDLMQVMYEAASGESGPRMEDRYRKQSQQVDALISGIDAKAFVHNVTEPTEAEIQAHFEEAKNRADAHTDEALVYGYRIPDRVRIEYLTVDPKELIPLVSARERDLKRYFEQNQKKYTKPVEGPVPQGSEPPPPIPLTFEEAKERVKEDFRLAHATEEAQSLMNRIRDEAYTPWQAMQPDAEGNRPPPATQANLSFEALAARHSKDVKVIHRITDLLTAEKLAQEPGLRSASVTENRRPVRAANLAFHVEGLPKQVAVGDRHQLHILEPSPVMLASATPAPGMSQAFVFRVVEAIPAGPPPSIDDVREQIVKNLKMKKALELAGEHAKSVAERAKAVGLLAAIAEAEDLKQMMMEADLLAKNKPGDPANPGNYSSRLEPLIPTQFTSQRVMAGNFESATAGALGIAAASQPTSESQPFHVLVVCNATSQTWGIVQINALKPLYSDEFKRNKQFLEMLAQRDTQRKFATTWMLPDSIRKRTGFTMKINAAK